MHPARGVIMRVAFVALIALLAFDQMWSHGANISFVMDLLRAVWRSFGFG
jgi:hypothetical protein